MKLVSLSLGVLLFAYSAVALPTHHRVSNAELIAIFEKSLSANYNFEGIVALSNCSGAIIRFEGSRETDRAIVMSNGHCVEMPGGFIKPGQFVVNKPVKRSFAVLNRDGSVNASSVIYSTRLIYATMTGTDISLYEVGVSYAEIEKKFKTKALLLASSHPAPSEAIQILSGYWKSGYECNLDGFVYHIKEDAYTWDDSIRYSKNGCHTIHGTSGAPILSTNTHQVIGINNTGNDDGGKCTMDNPCEVSENGAIYAEKGRSYGEQTYQIYSCLNEKNKVDLTRAGCKLLH